MTNAHRPLLLSVVQYQDELQSGTLTMPQIIDKAVVLGMDGIELRRDKWPNYQNELAETRALCEQAGLLVTFASFATLFTPDKESLQNFTHDVDTARDLGAGQIRVFQGPPPTSDPRYWGSARMEWEGAAMNLDYAKQQNVLVVLENFGTPPGCTVGEISGVLAQLWNPADLQTNVDIGNYASANENVVNAIQTLGSRIASTHLKDLPPPQATFAPPDDAPTYLGGGHLPLPDIFAAFAVLPQRILHVLEFAGGGEADERIRRSAAFLKSINALEPKPPNRL